MVPGVLLHWSALGKSLVIVGGYLMNGLFKIALLCLIAYAVTGCNKGAKSSLAPRLEVPLEIQGYQLGMSDRTALKHGLLSCQDHLGKLDADRICNASISVSGHPALMFFYFFNDSLEKLSLSILPSHGKLSEVSKLFSEALETKYGKPSTNSTSTVVWSPKGGDIIINSVDERTMTISLTSDKYKNEKTHRVKNAGLGVEI